MSEDGFNFDEEIEAGIAQAEKMLLRKKIIVFAGIFVVGALLLFGLVNFPHVLKLTNPTHTPTATYTKTPYPTATITLTATATKPPTPTPQPTATPTLLPAEAGEIVKGDSITFTVEEIKYRDNLHFNSIFFYEPKEGFVFLDVIVRVENGTLGATTIPWNTVLVREGNGGQTSITAPQWTYVDYVDDGQIMDPGRYPYIEFNTDDIQLASKKDAYIRAIYIIGDANEIVLFSIGDSQLVNVTTGSQ